MNTEIKFNKEARESLKIGVDIVANAVKVSMGAEGRTVILPSVRGGYMATKDGVTIARSILPADTFQAIGASMIKEASSRTNAQAGDGTTQAAVMTQEIFNEGLALLNDGVSPVQLKRGIDLAAKDVVKYLDDNAVEISKDNIKDVTTVAVNGDEVLGELIASAFNKIGEHGLVLTQVSDTKETYIESKEGLQLDMGYLDPVFITDPVKGECILENPYLLLYKGKIEKGDDVVKLFDAVWSKGKNNALVIICDDIDPFVMSTIATNIENGAIRGLICVIRTPQILKIHKELMGDIATLSGAKVVSPSSGNKLSATVLGKLQKAVISERESFLIGDIGNLSSTVAEITERIENTDNTIDKEDLQERLSRINGGVATLFIGAQTDIELKEKQDRIDDGINATRAALEEGIVPGGGTILIQAGDALLREHKHGGDLGEGYELVLRSIEQPYKQILRNAGIDSALTQPRVGFGIDVTTGKEVDMIEAGIIDPKKVTRCAIENACSVAGMFLTTEAVVALKV